MTIPLLTELPYRADSAALFEAVADRPWAVFLDSGLHHPGQARYDIIAAEPYIRLVTRGALTEVHAEHTELSRADPFELLRQYVAMDTACPPKGLPSGRAGELPFSGGAIGYFGYDLTRRIERLPARARDAERIPDMVIGIYDWAVVVDHSERRAWLAGQGRDPDTDLKWNALVRLFTDTPPERRRAPFRVTSPVTSNLTPQHYGRAFERVLDYISAGDCYQVNLAQRFSAEASGDPWLAYQRLRLINPAPYSAFLSTPYAQILSASPERFLRVENRQVETKPIKGTRPRAGHPRLDAELIAELVASEKDRAENLMIVDLLRNDLSKNCELGSVKVPKLFEVESFATVHHLVSTVTGASRRGAMPSTCCVAPSPAARSPVHPKCARGRSLRNSNRTAAVCIAAPSVMSDTTAIWTPISRSAPWCIRTARCASGRAAASLPIRSARPSTRKLSTRPRRCLACCSRARQASGRLKAC